MIDKNGKIFGKINILDLFVIVIIVAALIFGTIKFSSSMHSDYISVDDTVNYTLKIKAIRIGSVNAFNVGDTIFDRQTNESLGVIKKIVHEPAYEYVNLADGSITEPRPIPDKYDVYLHIECPGKISSKGFFLNGNKQITNMSTLNIYTKFINCFGQIDKIGQ